MNIDLNRAFPLGIDGTQGPLPKQQEFLNAAIRSTTEKYVAYVGGVGSGKTLIGCITMLCLAVLYPGDYLISRQFLPEMKVTTLKTFLEVCPPELIVEYRVADGIVRIKSQSGKVSNVIFRPLEDPDKLRSLNLNAFYIDEANQVSEAAFIQLQSRLRGQYVRKGFITSNPKGHDWIYRWFVKKDMFRSEESKKAFKLIKAPSTENKHLPSDYLQVAMETWSEDRIQKEIMGSFDAFEGQVYHEFRRDVHVIPPFAIPDSWVKIMGADHGYRNPAAFLWGAVDYDGDIYIYREFYKREWLIQEIANGKGNEPGVVQLTGKEQIQQIHIDPSTRNRRGSNGLSDFDSYQEHFPQGMAFALANNAKTSGIDRVKTFLKVNPRTNKPRLFIFNTCTNLIEEMSQYRYAELPTNQQASKSEKEEPVKVNDHALDALRYLIMSRPDPAKYESNPYETVKYNSLEGALYRDLQEIKKPKVTNPFDGM